MPRSAPARADTLFVVSRAVRKYLASSPRRVQEDHRLAEDLGAVDADFVFLVRAIEPELGVDLSVDEVARRVAEGATVGDLAAYVDSVRGAR